MYEQIRCRRAFYRRPRISRAICRRRESSPRRMSETRARIHKGSEGEFARVYARFHRVPSRIAVALRNLCGGLSFCFNGTNGFDLISSRAGILSRRRARDIRVLAEFIARIAHADPKGAELSPELRSRARNYSRKRPPSVSRLMKFPRGAWHTERLGERVRRWDN